MDWGSLLGGLIGGSLGGAAVAGVVSLVNNSLQLKRVDERLVKIELPRLQIEQARFELDRDAESRARERQAYDELLNVFHEMTKWLDLGIDSSEETERVKHELLADYDRAATKVSISGHANVRYFAVDAAQSFQAYVNSVLMGDPIEDLWDRFVNGQRAVQDMIKHYLERKPPA